MKPVYLEMNYFGPHEHSVIDFTKLEEAPIFLIGGDTGAGKSTIFDAMTYALFGSTTSSDRKPQEMRSQFATPHQATSVIFYFEQGNNLYKIARTPDQYLAKKRGKGLANNKSTANLSIVKDVGGVEIQSIASKPKDVGDEILDILNLSADQFKKIILLPQNDFSEFLKSDTNDKEAILKKIFGTQIFSQFTDELKIKYDQVNRQTQNFTSELNSQFNDDAWTKEEQEKISHEADNQKLVLLKQFLDHRQNSLTESQSESKAIRSHVDELTKKLQSAQDLQKKFNDLIELQNKYQKQIIPRKDEITSLQKHQQELTWADGLKDIIRDLTKENSESQKTTDSIKVIKKQLADTKATYQKAQESFDKLHTQVDIFEEKKQREKQLNIIIPQVQKWEALKDDLTKLTPQKDKLDEIIKQKLDSQNKLVLDIKNSKDKLSSLDDLQDQKDKFQKEQMSIRDSLTPILNQQNNLQAENKKIQDKVSSLEKDQQLKRDILTKAKTDYEKKILTRRSLMIAQLQQELVDGEPCVVCGATEHPNVEHIVEANETDLKKSMDAVDNSQKVYAAAETDFKNVQTNLNDEKVSLEQKNAELSSTTAELTAKYNEISENSSLDLSNELDLVTINTVFNEQLEKINIQIKDNKDQTKLIEQKETELTTLNDEISKQKITLAAKESEIKSIKSNLATYHEDVTKNTNSSVELISEQKTLLNDINDYEQKSKQAEQLVQDNKLHLTKIKTRLKDITDDLEKHEKNAADLNSKLQESLDSADAKTNDKEILKSWIDELNVGKLSNIQVTISKYEQEKQTLETDIATKTSELKDVNKPDVVGIQSELDIWQGKKDTAIKNETLAQTDFEKASHSFEKIQKIIQDQSDFATKLADITSLYNVVTGKDGNDTKLKLETYVVQNYLRKILNYANDHFINLLSNNRYMFEIADKGSDKRSDHGLDINVYDNETGDVRSSKTLSGGETFIAALSIALSLSEVVQSSTNGVQIEALFVDEGFGSLDHETLEKAMTALETIGENRMVGVISHIDSMKTTIGQQVLIKKIGDGRSKVEIISK